MVKKHIERYLSENRKNTFCKFKIQYLRFKKSIAFKMFLNRGLLQIKFMNNRG